MTQRVGEVANMGRLDLFELHDAEPPQSSMAAQTADDGLEVAGQEATRLEANVFKRALVLFAEGLQRDEPDTVSGRRLRTASSSNSSGKRPRIEPASRHSWRSVPHSGVGSQREYSSRKPRTMSVSSGEASR